MGSATTTPPTSAEDAALAAGSGGARADVSTAALRLSLSTREVYSSPMRNTPTPTSPAVKSRKGTSTPTTAPSPGHCRHPALPLGK